MNTWGETMGKNRNKKNKNNNVQIHEISTGDEGTRLIKIIVVILVLFAIFYFLTGYVSRYMNRRENQIDNTPETAIIQYDKIMIGEILNQTPVEYYVLLNNQDDFYQSVYDLYISEYENVGDHLKIYTVDLDDSFNAKYISEEENLQPENIAEFRIQDKALLKVSNHEITDVYRGEEILNELKGLTE